MRLIDADSIKFIEYVNGDITVSKKAIKNMPTAYDVDKVIEQLENEITATKTKCQTNVEFDIGIYKALEIVKSELKQE